MSEFQGAYFVVQGIPFASVLVRPSAISSQKAKEDAVAFFQPYFPSVPLVLAAQGSDGRVTFWGKDDLAKFLANNSHAIQWCNYST
ncbi:hypothetical protein [Pseudomonas aeruginosa]|uniref:hypothetical protein n=1 Tax=Pseudomonas aeruginosa TaxID=287 RepID=UPI0018C5B913|nr:hypothetical protein [Pseudomonas aeruginosa]MBG4984746.1 hypothetical protein [Pseudomonas aeruginosa]MBG6832958.1 hypothetical protein [Pseudomonas aeruginosa]MCV4115321.1 hypothetical protein [Pseudomonas aeruginosa]MCV4244280.1 hypothetical protein [Pseudomonas aeruginosa]MCV4254044.1 hypothetical protein [Pseudomonas aeruginosa]